LGEKFSNGERTGGKFQERGRDQAHGRAKSVLLTFKKGDGGR